MSSKVLYIHKKRFPMNQEKERIFLELQAEINQSVADMEQGIFYTKEDLVKRYGL